MFYSTIVKLISLAPDAHTSTKAREMCAEFEGNEQEAYDFLCHIFSNVPTTDIGGYCRLLSGVKRFYPRPEDK